MCVKNIMAGFRNTGIYPYNPLAIPQRQWPPVKSLTMVRHFGVRISWCWCWFLNFFLHRHGGFVLDNFKRNNLFTFLEREEAHWF